MLINKLDHVDINLEDGHKYALRDIKCGEDIIKYGNPIGHAIADIKAGEHVHTHNTKTNLSGNLTYTYEPKFYDIAPENKDATFMGYVRDNGEVGIRKLSPMQTGLMVSGSFIEMTSWMSGFLRSPGLTAELRKAAFDGIELLTASTACHCLTSELATDLAPFLRSVE